MSFKLLERYAAYIFDMDGTMIDNMPYHIEAWRQFLKLHDIAPLVEGFETQIAGKKSATIVREVFGANITDEQIDAYSAQKESLYKELYASDIKPLAGLIELLIQLKRNGKLIAVGTIAPTGNRLFALEKLDLMNTFDVIVGNEDVVRGKPDPEVYVTAAQRLGVDTSDCVVFEDSTVGIQAAKAAGMATIGIATSDDDLSTADIIVSDFTELLR